MEKKIEPEKKHDEQSGRRSFSFSPLFIILVILTIIILALYSCLIYKNIYFPAKSDADDPKVLTLISALFKILYCCLTVNKVEAEPHSVPCIVSLQEKCSREHVGAGAIIDEHFILTAAHVLHPVNEIKKLVAVSGAHDVGDTSNVQIRKIDDYAIHPRYSADCHLYDFALIYTEVPFEFNEYVQPIKLAESTDKMKDDSFGDFYGWGNLSKYKYLDIYPAKLQKAKMPILASARCKSLYGIEFHKSHHFGAGSFDGELEIGDGDSGGPFIWKDLLYGIATFGRNLQAQTDPMPAVFSFVGRHKEWIERQKRKLTYMFTDAGVCI